MPFISTCSDNRISRYWYPNLSCPVLSSPFSPSLSLSHAHKQTHNTHTHRSGLPSYLFIPIAFRDHRSESVYCKLYTVWRGIIIISFLLVSFLNTLSRIVRPKVHASERCQTSLSPVSVPVTAAMWAKRVSFLRLFLQYICLSDNLLTVTIRESAMRKQHAALVRYTLHPSAIIINAESWTLDPVDVTRDACLSQPMHTVCVLC